MTDEEEVGIFKKAFKELGSFIRKKHFSKRQPIVYLKDGWIVKEFWNGRIEKVKKI